MPPLLEGSIYHYKSDDSVTVSPDHGQSSFLISPPSTNSLSLSIPSHNQTTPPRCSTPYRQHSSSPVVGHHPDNHIEVSSQCNASLTDYRVKDLELITKDREDLVSGEWLSDKHVCATNKLLAFPTINGLQDTVVLSELSRYRSGAQNFVQTINISWSH